MVPHPYDLIGDWAERHNLDLSQEAYLELARMIIGDNGEEVSSDVR